MSEKKIEDYLHLYLGCKVVVEGKEVAKFMQYDINDKVCSVEFDSGRDYNYYTTDHIKPILRPLRDMTSEEMKELISINRDSQENIKNIHKEDYMIFFQKQVKKMKHWVTDRIDMRQPLTNEFLFLLKCGFDLFGLIEEGLAMDKTKIFPPNLIY